MTISAVFIYDSLRQLKFRYDKSRGMNSESKGYIDVVIQCTSVCVNDLLESYNVYTDTAKTPVRVEFRAM